MIFEVRACHNCNGKNLVRNGKNATIDSVIVVKIVW